MANPIEGYASATSVVQGRSLDLHVRSAGADKYFSVQVHRVGATDTLVGTAAGLGSTFIPTGPQDDATLAQQGCAWPVGYTLQVDPSWSSGLYYAQLTGYADAAGTMPTGDSTKVSFVVTPASPGSQARI